MKVSDVRRNLVFFEILGPQMEKVCFPNWVIVLVTTAALNVEERS